ncbi:MAG: FliA/WhiG family RNA polymerase sigma factor [Planctomycetota bacterium]
MIPPDTRTLTKEEERTLWRYFKKTRDVRARNRLLTHYRPLVRYAAERIKTRLPREIELDDLEAAGFFGLLDAVNGFDLTRGVKFETYCGPRIRGAILDELRVQDWVPRLVRARANRLAWARGACETELGRPPRPQEVADKLGCSVKEYTHLCREASTVGVFHVTQNVQDEESGRGVREIEGLQDHNGEDPSSQTQREDLKELIMKGLNKKERLILILYYYEGLTMREIGHSLGLSESRVSQIHASLLLRLKKHLHERRPEFDIHPVPSPI